MNYFLLKRNPDIAGRIGKKFTSSGIHWYVNTQNGGYPSHSKSLEVNDIVYLYEKNYAVWGKGKVKEKVLSTKPLKNIEDFLRYVDKSNLQNRTYWGQLFLDKIKNYHVKKNLNLYICEFKIDQEVLDSPIIIIDKKGRNSFQKLSGPLEAEKEPNLILSESIPSTLRFKLYMYYQIELKTFIFDIDHVVPSSLGGPGNIEENLYPLPYGINRKKSDWVPNGLFVTAIRNRKIFDKISKKAQSFLNRNISDYKRGEFKSDNDSKEVAKELINLVRLQDIKTIKEFFSEIKDFQYPIIKCEYCDRR